MNEMLIPVDCAKTCAKAEKGNSGNDVTSCRVTAGDGT